MTKSGNKRKINTKTTYERNILNKLKLIQAIGVIVIIINWLLPSTIEGWRFNLFDVAVSLVWLFGILVVSGHFCKNTFIEDEDLIIYEQNTTPVIISLAVTRMCEAGFNYIFARAMFNWKMFAIAVVIDVIYLAMILMDKGHYGYALEKTYSKE